MNRSWKIILALLIALVTSYDTLGAASGDQIGEIFTLEIFGNANMDDTIDDRDVTYVEGVIKGTNVPTNLSDANYDGKVNSQDIVQIKAIMSGEEKTLTIVDGNGEAVTVRNPVERIIVEYMDTAEMIRTLGETDKIVGVTNCMTENKNQFPELSERSSIGKMYPGEPDYEAILALHPDLYLTFTSTGIEEKEKNLHGVAVVYLGQYYPDLIDVSKSTYTAGLRKLGYILNRNDEAEEYLKWYTDLINEIQSQTEKLSEDEETRVFITARIQPQSLTFKTYPLMDKLSQMCAIAGGDNLAENLPEFIHPVKYDITLDPEWVIEQSPEFIFVLDSRTPYGYDMDDPTRMMQTREMFMNHSMLTNVTAVTTENVHVINGVLRNDGTGGAIGAAYMAKLLHPDLFKDLDPQAIHQEYLTRFQHLDYDLDKHGVFFYPPLNETK